MTDPAPRLVFLGGLHRSGTTLLARMLAEHPEITGLRDTGVPQDEGQHLHDVVPAATRHGGPGKFAFDARSHLIESDAAAIPDAASRMLAAWLPFTEPGRSWLVEKSPTNLLRFRFLQSAFPDAACIAIVRHPVAVAYATEFWARRGISDLLEHWLHAHETFEADRAHLARLEFVRYEDLVADPNGKLHAIDRFLGIDAHDTNAVVQPDTNERYFRRFRHSRVLPSRLKIARDVRRFESRLRALGYGYSLTDGDR